LKRKRARRKQFGGRNEASPKEGDKDQPPGEKEVHITGGGGTNIGKTKEKNRLSLKKKRNQRKTTSKKGHFLKRSQATSIKKSRRR